MTDVTHLLDAAAAGDRQAAADLLSLVYEELRKLAGARMASERPGHTLDPTALVHEAYLRLVARQSPEPRYQRAPAVSPLDRHPQRGASPRVPLAGFRL